MEAGFDRLAVVGMGLLGGSVALAARERGVVKEVRAVDPYQALPRDFARISLVEAAEWADLLVLATPADAIDAVLQELAPHLGPETLITDTVSVKRPVARAAHRWLAHPERCVGAHPMAGGEQSGFEHASPELFVNAPCLLALEGSERACDVARVEGFWQQLGARTSRHSPEEHDAIVALLSHAPHLIAFAYAMGLADSDALDWAGPGLRDFLRIARANPALWCEILLANRDQVLEAADAFRGNFDELVGALVDADRTRLTDALERGRAALEQT